MPGQQAPERSVKFLYQPQCITIVRPRMNMNKNPVDLLLLAMLAFLLGAFLALPAVAQDTSDQQCRALTKRDFSRTQDAPFTLTGASVMTQNVSRPFCELDGYIIPEISFKMRLPIVGWNGRFILLGSGGWANRKFDFLCDDPLFSRLRLHHGGRRSSIQRRSLDAEQPTDQDRLGYRATHVVALAGKALVQAFYLTPPIMSLMLGVSTGGYQGLVEAQRFPWDFGGIIAIAPDIDEGDLSTRTAWIANHLLDENGGPLFHQK